MELYENFLGFISLAAEDKKKLRISQRLLDTLEGKRGKMVPPQKDPKCDINKSCWTSLSTPIDSSQPPCFMSFYEDDVSASTLT
jgi:hypothetical protein